jgi:putative transposase
VQKQYSKRFKARVVERMSGPRRLSAKALSKEFGIHHSTLSHWRQEAASVASVKKNKALAETAALLMLQGKWRPCGRQRTTPQGRAATNRPQEHQRGARSRGALEALLRSGEDIGVRTVQRWRQEENGGDDRRHGPNTVPGNKLSEHEERRLLRVLALPEYRDLSPRQVIPALAEQGTYIASEATAYRVLHKHDMQKHRENTRPPTSKKPEELVATAPNQVYGWDITYLKRSILGTFFYLYLVTDIFSRRIVAARVYEAENDEHAAELFTEVQEAEQLVPGKTTLHADNGNPMKGATLKATLEKLGVAMSYSRPRVSDDNPYVESLFGTMKSRVGYPKKPFETLEEAQVWVDKFVHWYNEEHRHSALNWVTPMARHSGEEHELLRRREQTYRKSRQRNPNRWSRGIRNCQPASAVTLNPIKKRIERDKAA